MSRGNAAIFSGIKLNPTSTNPGQFNSEVTAIRHSGASSSAMSDDELITAAAAAELSVPSENPDPILVYYAGSTTFTLFSTISTTTNTMSNLTINMWANGNVSFTFDFGGSFPVDLVGGSAGAIGVTPKPFPAAFRPVKNLGWPITFRHEYMVPAATTDVCLPGTLGLHSNGDMGIAKVIFGTSFAGANDNFEVLPPPVTQQTYFFCFESNSVVFRFNVNDGQRTQPVALLSLSASTTSSSTSSFKSIKETTNEQRTSPLTMKERFELALSEIPKENLKVSSYAYKLFRPPPPLNLSLSSSSSSSSEMLFKPVDKDTEMKDKADLEMSRYPSTSTVDLSNRDH
jgi:hypothetical protein